jgi:hypothetical protein
LVSTSAYETEPALAPAAAAAAEGRTGRAVLFDGSAGLVGTMAVGDVLAGSAIDRVEVLGGGVATPDALLDTRDFVRPQFRDGELVLTTTPAAGGLLIPFEVRNPTPCCAGH